MDLSINNLAYLEETSFQIKKDFEMTAINIEFTGNALTAYSELFYQITPIIEDLINRDFNRLLRLLYRIDINEGKLKVALSKNAEISSADVITELIIKRELQKVVIRHQMRNEIN